MHPYQQADHMQTVTPCPFGKIEILFYRTDGGSTSTDQKEPAMEYLVTMTTHAPDGTPEQAVDDIRAREAAQSRGPALGLVLLRRERPEAAAPRALPTPVMPVLTAEDRALARASDAESAA
jgi:hypothetical protein